MFPVLLLVTRSPETPTKTEDEIARLFLPDLEGFGEATFRGSMIMSCGPFGANMFYRFRIHPPNASKLAVLLEYAQEPHHGFVSGILRINDGVPGPPAARLGTPLSFDGIGCEWIEELAPPEVIPLNAEENPEHFQLQLEIKAAAIKMVEHISSLEAQIIMLKNRIRLLGGDA